MRLAAVWTKVMAVTIGLVAVGICVFAFGSGVLAWIVAVPVAFVGLQVIGLPVVLGCELLERVGLLRRKWRSVVDEVLLVTVLCAVGYQVFPSLVALLVVLFFTSMFVVRITSWWAWIPGEAKEVSG